MTATPVRPHLRRAELKPPPRYRWLPITAAVIVALGLTWGAAMYYLASH